MTSPVVRVYDKDDRAPRKDAVAPTGRAPDRLRAHVLEGEGSILGFFTLSGDPPEGELVHLYVDPAAIGAGVGVTLFRAACEIARREGFRRLLIHSDPNAVPFYSRQGARQVGEVPSGSIPGRLLSLLELDLSAASRNG